MRERSRVRGSDGRVNTNNVLAFSGSAAPHSAVAQQVTYMETVTVTAPPGVRSGQEMSFRTVDGQVFKVVVPPNVPPGGAFSLQIP